MTSASCPSPPLSRVSDCTPLPVDTCGQRFSWFPVRKTRCGPRGGWGSVWQARQGGPGHYPGWGMMVCETPGPGVPEAVRTLGDGREGGEQYLHVSPHPSTIPGTRGPRLNLARLPGFLPVWFPLGLSLTSAGRVSPSCLHSSAVKTATLGPGLAGTPPSGSVRAGEDVQGLTRGHLPLCARTWMRWVPVCAWTCLCVPTGTGEGTHACGDIRACMRGAGRLCVQGGADGPLGVPQACSHGPALVHSVGVSCMPPISEGPCTCEGHIAR